MPKPTFFNLDKEKRNQIIAVSLEEFSEHTFEEASVNTIVKRSKISKGSLYQYFDDKKELYLYLIEIAGDKKFTYLKTCETCMHTKGFVECFTDLMVLGCEYDLANPAHSKLLHRTLTGPLVDESIEKMLEMNRRFMRNLIERGIAAHQVRNDVDLDTMVFYLSSMTLEFAKLIAVKAGVTYYGDMYKPEHLHKVRSMDLVAVVKELMKLMAGGLSPLKQS
nr:TetR/AcrR family transcriptional regulator [uncultured Sphaerochaeta sp.]